MPGIYKLESLKKRGSRSEGKVPMPPLNNFSDFFLKKSITIFVTFKGDYAVRFSTQSEKTKYRKIKLKNFSFLTFSQF